GWGAENRWLTRSDNVVHPARSRRAADSRRTRMGSGRLLLGNAMQRTEAPDQFRTVDPNHFATGETVADDLACFGVPPRLAEGGDEHGVVDDEKIRIARRHTLAVDGERPGHRQRAHVEGF